MLIFHEEHLLGASDVSHIRYGMALIIVMPELASAIFLCALISLPSPQRLRIMIMKQFHETVSITLSNTYFIESTDPRKCCFKSMDGCSAVAAESTDLRFIHPALRWLGTWTATAHCLTRGTKCE